MKKVSIISLLLFSASLSATEKGEKSEEQPSKTLLQQLFNHAKESPCVNFPDCDDEVPGDEVDESYYKELQNKKYKSMKSKSKKKPNNAI